MGFCFFIVPAFHAAIRCQNCNLFQPKDTYSSLFSSRSDPGVDLVRKLLNLSALRRLSPARGWRWDQGFLYLCVLPSTVSTSVVLTSVAGGNTAAAVLSAAFSNIIGVILTPLLVSFLMHATGHGRPIGPLLIQITMLTLLPFAAGVILRRFVQHWVDANKRWTNPISNGVILFIVYTAFCDSVTERIWNKYGVILTVEVLLIVVCLFGTISLLIYLASRAARLNREDAIAVYFCSVKKTLAMGVPLAMLIFGSRADLSLILLPIMFYHPFQLLVNGLLANHWASQRTTANDNEHQRTTVNSKRHSAG